MNASLDDLIPLVAIICVFGLPIGGWIVLRVLKHQERMEMIRRGMDPGPDFGWQRKWPNAGPPLQQPAYPVYGPPSYAQRQLHRGIMTTSVGAALLIGLSFVGYHDGGWQPGPWLLGGLVPMFVGLAQIVGAMLSGAEFPSRRTGTFTPGPPPPPPASGPYTYRPSGNQEELPRTKPPQQT